jgi:hypothetical protein
VIGSSDGGDILSGKLPCSAVDQMPHIAGINKKDFIKFLRCYLSGPKFKMQGAHPNSTLFAEIEELTN